MLRLRTLGGLSIENAAATSGLPAHRRPLAVLALLAAEGRRGLSRDKIVALLWPESDSERGRNSLSQVISLLRRELGADDIVLGAAELRLNAAVIACDVIEFEERIAANDLQKAIALYSGPFLDGVFLRNTPDFERWVDQERSRLQHIQRDALEQLATRATAIGDHVSAARHWRQRASLAPSDSRTAFKLMESLVALGDPAGALEHYRDHHTLLRDDLGLEPDAALTEFAAAVRGGGGHSAKARLDASVKIAALGDSSNAASAPALRDGSPRAETAETGDLVPGPTRPIGVPTPRRRAALLATSAGIALMLVAAAFMISRQRQKSSVAAVTQHTQVTFHGGVLRAEISPDGAFLAYLTRALDTTPGLLLVSDLSGASTIRLAAVKSAMTIKWSPNRTLLMWSGLDSAGRQTGLIYPSLGGTPRPSLCGFGNGAWSQDGARLACWKSPANTRISFVDLATLDTSSIPPPDTVSFHYDGAFSPSGGLFALADYSARRADRSRIWGVRRGDSTWHLLVADSARTIGLAWSSSGDAVYYVSGDELRKLSVRSDGTARGTPQVLQTGVGGGSLSITSDRRTLAYVRSQHSSIVWSATEIGGVGSGRFSWTQLTQGTTFRSSPAISPDGGWVAYREGNAGDIVVVPFDGGAPRRITASARAQSAPAWSPDGNQLAFWVFDQGERRLRTVNLERGSERTHEKTAVGDAAPTWAPGNRILYQRLDNQNYHFLDPRTGDEELLVAKNSSGWKQRALAAPDGRFVAVSWNRKPEYGVWLISMRDSSARLLWPGLANPIGWSADGRSVYVSSGKELRLFSVNTDRPARVISIPYPAEACHAVERPTGLRLACTVRESISDAWILKNFDPQAAARAK